MPATVVRARNCLSTRSFNTQIPCHTRTPGSFDLPTLPLFGRSPGAWSFVSLRPGLGASRRPRRGSENARTNPDSQPAKAGRFPQGLSSLSGPPAAAGRAGRKYQGSVSHRHITHSLTMSLARAGGLPHDGWPRSDTRRSFSAPGPGRSTGSEPDPDDYPDGLSRTCENFCESPFDMLDTPAGVPIYTRSLRDAARERGGPFCRKPTSWRTAG